MNDQEKQEDAAGEPRIELRGAFRLVGMYYAGKNERGEIPGLWAKDFLPRLGELIPNPSAGFVCYGACRMPEDPASLEPGAFEYLASVEAPSGILPEGMTAWDIPAQAYAVLPAHDIPGIPRVFDYLYGTWIRESAGWEAADGPCFELYPASYPEDPTIDVYVPVQPKRAGAGA